MSAPDRRARLDRDHPELSIRRQCRLLSVARSSVYRLARPANDDDVLMMRLIDELFTAWPFLGSRRLAVMLREKGSWALEWGHDPNPHLSRQPRRGSGAHSARSGTGSRQCLTRIRAAHGQCGGRNRFQRIPAD